MRNGRSKRALEEWNWVYENKVKLLLMEDDDYPELLLSIKDPPILLFYKGDLNILSIEHSLSVVGTRRASGYGREFCHQLAKGLIKYGPRICSGLALGIDSEIHRSCLEHGHKCIAVIPTGFDKIYPAENMALFHKLTKEGLILSEYPHREAILSYKFVQRNRIIAGLSSACLVVESREKGGSLITAEMAYNEHRDVYVLPGRYFDQSSRGCHKLLHQQIAKPFVDIKTMVSDLFWEISERSINRDIRPESMAFEWFADRETKSFQALLSSAKINEKDLRIKLVELELEGYIKKDEQGDYRWVKF